MKLRIICLLITLVPVLSAVPPAKYFEGEIDYDVSYESHQADLSIAQLEVMYGVKEQFFISGGRYKALTDGQLIEMQLYDPLSNRLYNKLADADTLVFFEAAFNRDTIQTFSVMSSSDTVLGHPCQSVSYTSLSGTATYFFSNDFPIDAAKFDAHQYANWAFYCEKAHAVPLKMIINSRQWKMTATATDIRPLKLDSLFFRVPKGLLLPGRN